MTRNTRVVASGILGTLCFFVARTAVAGNSRIYVTNSAGDSVTVVNPVTNKVVQVIAGIGFLMELTFPVIAQISVGEVPKRINTLALP